MNASSKYAEIREAALALAEEDRVALVDDLLNSMDEREITPEEGVLWGERLADLESGRVTGVPLEKALAEARAGLRRDAEAKPPSRGR